MSDFTVKLCPPLIVRNPSTFVCAVTSVSLSHNDLTGLNLPSNSLPFLTELNSEYIDVILPGLDYHRWHTTLRFVLLVEYAWYKSSTAQIKHVVGSAHFVRTIDMPICMHDQITSILAKEVK